PAAGDGTRARLHGGEVRARAGLAHEDRERALAARDRRKEALLLRFSAVTEQQRSGLPLRDPMRSHWSTGGEQLLGDRVALDVRAVAPAVRRRPIQTDPSARAERAAECACAAG